MIKNNLKILNSNSNNNLKYKMNQVIKKLKFNLIILMTYILKMKLIIFYEVD